jgi:hypothetical protein
MVGRGPVRIEGERIVGRQAAKFARISPASVSSRRTLRADRNPLNPMARTIPEQVPILHRLAMSFGKGCSLKNHENNKPW